MESEQTREELLDKLHDLVSEMDDEQLLLATSVIEQLPNPPDNSSDPISEVDLDTADLSDAYFQGYMEGAQVKHRVLSEVGNSVEVKYVAPRSVLVRLVEAFWKTHYAEDDQARINSIKALEGGEN